MDRKGFTPIFIVMVFAVIIIVGVVGYFAVIHYSAVQNSPSQQSITITANNSTTLSSTSPQVFTEVSSSFPTSGTIASTQTSTDQYGLFISNPLYPNETLIDNYGYDGTVSSGPYTGYHILIVSTEAGIPGNDVDYIFATKDYKTFILDSNTDPTANEDLGNVFTSKVIAAAPIPIAFPETIPMGNFILVRQPTADFQPIPTSTVALTSPISGLTIYGFAKAAMGNGPYIGPADVFGQDSSGVVFGYTFESKEEFARANPTDFNANFYESNEISTQVPIYQTYSQLVFDGCGEGTDYVLNIASSGLRQIGSTLQGVALYVPQDTSSSLYQDEYYAKVTEWIDNGVTSTYSSETSSGIPFPSYQNYVAKNPILVFQDPWGRWIGIGEMDNEAFTEGCGKPVIYLYPQKPTEVSVKFATPVQLTTDIPTYVSDGWSVLAQPDGELEDLQPQFTDCAAIDSTIAGSEYALNACKHNDYPYLYWEGNASNPYPIPQGGWIVSQSQISSFLSDKLTTIGLTDKEKNDMMSYWVPQLLKKDSPYYRISFFQTQQMNQFIPMDISPKPDTMIRVFLDWSPLQTMPSVLPQPEVLDHINRNGFTVVEWGGLKQ